MKKVIIALVVLVLLAAAAGVYWLQGNLDALVARALVDYGGAMTQARVQLGSVQIQTTDGRGTMGGLIIGNPKGFQTAHAIKADRVVLEVDLATLAQDVIVIKKVLVVAPEVIYEKGASQTNFDALLQNVASYLNPEGKPPAKGKEKRFIVQDFELRDIKVQASAAFMGGKTLAMTLPDVHLRDLGRAKGGATAGELGQAVIGAIKAKLTGAVSFDKLLKSASGTLDKAGQAIKGLFR